MFDLVCLRPRGPRLGSIEYADVCDQQIDSKNAPPLVRVGPSTVCDGLGIFATRSIPKCTPVTAYPYVLKTDRIAARTRSNRTDLGNDYAYQWPNGDVLDAHPTLLKQCSNRNNRDHHTWGVAHLANDAVHPELTGKTNNCVFYAVERLRPNDSHRLFLVTSRAVRKGEELLVSYSLHHG